MHPHLPPTSLCAGRFRWELESLSISALSSYSRAGFITTGHPVYPRSPGMGCTLMPAAVRN
jgi:hypothetical protein